MQACLLLLTMTADVHTYDASVLSEFCCPHPVLMHCSKGYYSNETLFQGTLFQGTLFQGDDIVTMFHKYSMGFALLSLLISSSKSCGKVDNERSGSRVFMTLLIITRNRVLMLSHPKGIFISNARCVCEWVSGSVTLFNSVGQ